VLAGSDIEQLTAELTQAVHPEKVMQLGNQSGLVERWRPSEERDAKFREFLARAAAPRVKLLAMVEIAGALLLQFGRMAGGAGRMLDAAPWWQTGAMMAVGAATLAAARFKPGWPRLLGAVSAWGAAALLLAVSAWRQADMAGADDVLLGAITVVLVTAAALLPLAPRCAVAMGLGVEGVHILCSRLSPHAMRSQPHHIFLLLVALLAAGIAAANYEHWRGEFAAVEDAVRAAETLAGAQLRAQLAESALSLGKMAAALTHEINSPLGTLRSSIKTLEAMEARGIERPETRADLVRSMEAPAARIEEVTRRLGRLVALEDADMKAADLNDLLAEVLFLHEEEMASARVRLETELEKPLPPLNCRPQLLQAVFSALLSNAIQAVNGDGRIAIRSAMGPDGIEVTIRDNGRGMAAEEAETMFEPRLKVAEGRVASGNWSLFHSRQIVYEHGGNIKVETEEGRGTAVHVTLPAG
jgi:signal transduction histidine kinase